MNLLLLVIHPIEHYHRLPVRPIHRPFLPLPRCFGHHLRACPVHRP